MYSIQGRLMSKIFASFWFCICSMLCVPAFAAGFSCGDGYVLTGRSARIDGINTMECQKLWCMDLETGDMMGNGNNVTSGYRATNSPVELSDNRGNSIMCFGDRKWCSGETPGIWNPEYGAYTRNGADSTTYKAFKKSGCWAWRLEKPVCDEGMTAFLINDEWVCGTPTENSKAGRASAIRRTGAIRIR